MTLNDQLHLNFHTDRNKNTHLKILLIKAKHSAIEQFSNVSYILELHNNSLLIRLVKVHLKTNLKMKLKKKIIELIIFLKTNK